MTYTDDDSPLTRMINMMFSDAVKRGASRVHYEPYRDSFRVRYLIGGSLHEVMRPPVKLRDALIARLKIMAGVDVTEKRLPQAGIFSIMDADGKRMTVRASFLPTRYGQAATLKFADQGEELPTPPSLDELELSEKSLEVWRQALRRPKGMILFAGDFWDAKSASMSASLTDLVDEDLSLYQIGPSVDFELGEVHAIKTKDAIGYTPRAALMATLAHSPDVVAIQELLEADEAFGAFKSSLHDCLVLTSIPAPDAASALFRLTLMGIDPYLVATSVHMVVVQRMIRKLCPECNEMIELDDEVFQRLQLPSINDDDEHLICGPVGCDACGQTGFHGEIILNEVIPMTPELQRALINDRPREELEAAVEASALQTLKKEAMQKLLHGETALEEVLVQLL